MATCTNLTLTRMHSYNKNIHMKSRTTLILDDELLEEARKLTGLEEKTAVIHEALRALVRRESARQLAELGGSQPDLEQIPRRRSEPDR
jgi:Arc/MetJ family transcription regulator